MNLKLIFDLASLTKPIATATALAICMDRKLVIILTNHTGDHDRSELARIDLAEHLLKEMMNN